MANGNQGDHPLTDILHHGLDVYSAKADGLVREIVQLVDEKGFRELGDRLYRGFNPYMNLDVSNLELELAELRDRLKKEARLRGFDLRDE